MGSQAILWPVISLYLHIIRPSSRPGVCVGFHAGDLAGTHLTHTHHIRMNSCKMRSTLLHVSFGIDMHQHLGVLATQSLRVLAPLIVLGCCKKNFWSPEGAAWTFKPRSPSTQKAMTLTLFAWQRHPCVNLCQSQKTKRQRLSTSCSCLGNAVRCHRDEV